MSIEARTWSVGELARRTGLTVRALHHYDEQGLLRPGERTAAGHRRYGAADVERLYRVVALRRLGLSLEQIGEMLDGEGVELGDVVDRQLALVEERLAEQQRLRGLLRHIRDTLDGSGRPAVEDILKAIERTTMVEQHYTPEQLETLARRREALGGDEGMRRIEEEWAGILGALREAMEAGTDPADPSLRRHGERANELVRAFTGGDPEMAASLERVWDQEDPEEVSRGMVDRELFAYLGRVQQAAAAG